MEESTPPPQTPQSSPANLEATANDGANSGAKDAEVRRATPLRCFTGALTSATLSLLAYRLTVSVAATFASKPVTSDNPAVVNISAAVRTLVTGIVALGAGVFGIAALGLAALGLQLLFSTTRQTDDAESATRAGRSQS